MRPNDPGCLLLHTTTPFLLKSPTHRPRKMERNQTPQGDDSNRIIKGASKPYTKSAQATTPTPKHTNRNPKNPRLHARENRPNQTIRSTTFRTNRLQHNRRISRKPRCTPEQTSKSKRLDSNQNLVKQYSCLHPNLTAWGAHNKLDENKPWVLPQPLSVLIYQKLNLHTNRRWVTEEDACSHAKTTNIQATYKKTGLKTKCSHSKVHSQYSQE